MAAGVRNAIVVEYGNASARDALITSSDLKRREALQLAMWRLR
jgi:hypothetical protein